MSQPRPDPDRRQEEGAEVRTGSPAGSSRPRGVCMDLQPPDAQAWACPAKQGSSGPVKGLPLLPHLITQGGKT